MVIFHISVYLTMVIFHISYGIYYESLFLVVWFLFPLVCLFFAKITSSFAKQEHILPKLAEMLHCRAWKSLGDSMQGYYVLWF